MSETTPGSVPDNGTAAEPAEENAPTTAATAPATAPAQSAAAEPADTDPEVVDPPSSPVSARGHINRPDAPAAAASEVPATPAPAAPAKVTEPEPVVATDDDIAAAVARSNTGDVPAAAAAGTATVDTASPAQSATPVIVAAEAATAATAATAANDAQATTAYAAQPAAGEATWAPEAGAAATTAYAQPVTPIYVQRPEPPKKKSNRGFGILIALVGTIVFAALWVLAVLIVGYALTPSAQFLDSLATFFTTQIASWVPVVAFFVGMVVLIQIINRARWWAYILGGLFVAVFVYVAYVGASLVDVKVWNLTPNEASIVLQRLWVAPFAVLAGVIAREISMWTGAWLAARGRKLKVRNAEAQAAYDQALADAQNQAVAAYATPQGY